MVEPAALFRFFLLWWFIPRWFTFAVADSRFEAIGKNSASHTLRPIFPRHLPEALYAHYLI